MNIIVRIQGGLGNQMFQIALAFKYKLSGYTVYIDTSSYRFFNSNFIFNIKRLLQIIIFKQIRFNFINRRFQLYRVFKIKFPKKEFYYSLDSSNANYKVIFQKKFMYQNLKLPNENLYLDGYWASFKYFQKEKNEIVKIFKFEKIIGLKNILINDMITSSNSVSIHVRRGDYNYTNNKNIYAECSLDYYLKAINIISKAVISPTFFIFSDDIKWCRQNFNLENAEYIDWNKNPSNNHYDMHLMKNCKHNIIANSSFSWWAAYLNDNPKKIVCAPKFWYKEIQHDSNEIVLEDWETINNI